MSNIEHIAVGQESIDALQKGKKVPMLVGDGEYVVLCKR